jgi:hypothetical protein
LAGPKIFGLKVENPKKIPVEILKSEKSSGKIQKILKICADLAGAGKDPGLDAADIPRSGRRSLPARG